MKDLKTNIELSFETKGRQDLSSTLRTVNSIKDALKTINSLKTGLSGAGKSIDSVSSKVQTQTNKMEGLDKQVKLASASIAAFTGKQKGLNSILKDNATALQAQVAAMREMAKLGGKVGGYTGRYVGTNRAGMGGRPALGPDAASAKAASDAAKLAAREARETAAQARREEKAAVADKRAAEAAAYREKRLQLLEQATQQRAMAKEQRAAALEQARVARAAYQEQRAAQLDLRRQERNAILSKNSENAALYRQQRMELAQQMQAQRAASRNGRATVGYDSWITGQLNEGITGNRQGRTSLSNLRRRSERRFANSVSSVASGGGVGGVVTGAAAAAGGLGIFNSMKEMDGLRKQLEAVSGSTEKANDRFKFLNDTANRLGANTKSLIGTFTGFSVAGEAAGMTEQEIRKITESITQANTVMNAANPETLKRGMIALQQMLGKGTVQMEELKGQFGDAFKDAIPTAAKAAGVSVDELTKRIESGSVRAREFVNLLAMEYEKKFASAAEKASQSIQAQQNRLANTFNQIIDQLNTSGAADGIADAFKEINAAFKEAFDPEAVKATAQAIGTLAREIGKAVATVIKFVAANPEIVTMGAKVLAVVAAMGALKVVVGTVLGPVAALMTALGGFSLMGRLAKDLAKAILGIGTASNTANGSVRKLLGGAAALGTASYVTDGVGTALDAKDTMRSLKEKGWSEMTAEEAEQKLKTLEASKSSLLNRAGRGIAGWLPGDNPGNAVDQEIELGKGRLAAIKMQQRAKYSTEQKQIKDKEEAERKAAQAEIDKQQAELRDSLFKPGKTPGAGSDGRTASAQANEMRSAARAAARITTEAELDVIRAARERKLAELDRELEAGRISYANYFNDIKQARLAEIDEEKAAVMDRIDDEIGAEKIAQADARDAASQKAIQVRIDALEQSKISKELAFQEKTASVIADTEERRSKAVKDLAREYAALASEVDAFDGNIDLSNLRANLEEQYSSLRQSFMANGNTAGAGLIDAKINNEVARARLGNMDNQLDSRRLEVQNQIAALELQVMERKAYSFDIENQTLALKKQIAAETLRALEAELAVTDDAKTRLELQARILEQKQALTEKTADQKAAEDSVSGALNKMFGDAQTLTVSLKDLIGNFVRDIANDMQRQLSQKLSEMAMNAIFPKDGQGSDSIVGQLLNGFGQMVMGGFGGGAGAGASGGGNFFAGLSAAGAPAGTGLSLGQIGASGATQSGGGSVVNMVINTPDANSFRASKTQINQTLFSAGQRAAQRS